MIKPELKKIAFFTISSLILSLILSGTASSFSLGKIKISSHTSDAFYAEIPVRLDGKYPFSSAIGGIQDYERLGLNRDSAVDNMAISLGVLSDGEAVIRLSSQERILKPSLNILIKASHNGGTILENYLIAVDYQKSLSLSIPLKVDKKETAATVLKEPVSPKEDVVLVKSELDIVKPVEVTPIPSPKIKIKSKPIAVPAPIKKEAMPKLEKDEASPVIRPRTNIVKVKRGDNLYKIATKIGATKGNLEQVVVAIWMLNADSFAYKNMNYVVRGMPLKVEGALAKGQTISKAEAGRIIRAQWRETLHVKRPISIEEVGSANMSLLPMEEFKGNETDIYSFILAWKESWESGDIEGHLGLYSKDFKNLNHNYNSWNSFKRRFTKKHGAFNLDLGDVQIQWMGNQIIASFRQHFKSKIMDSVGTKILYLGREKGVIKVMSEVWRRELPESVNHPFVVEVASHSFKQNVIRRINELRREGYSIYSLPWVIGGKRYYKVFIDRFSTEIESSIFANKLLKKRLVDYAFPLRLPYVVEVGVLDNRAEAISSINVLRDKGFTSYPLINCSSNGCSYRIVVGAFKNQRGALYFSNKLKEIGIDNSVVAP